jgi:transcriptional regulator with XRE-family HTH domain
VGDAQTDGKLPLGGGTTDTSGRRVTINQVVAHNVMRFRKAAGLTQEELGERLGGWTKAAVSAAERSWDGKRIRQFDADTLAALATALGIPLLALFLPPDAGEGERFLFRAHERGAPPSTMADLMALIMPDNDDDTPAMQAYRERLVAAAGTYIDPGLSEDVGRWLQDATDAELRAQRLERIRWQREALLAAAEDLAQFAQTLTQTGGQSPTQTAEES